MQEPACGVNHLLRVQLRRTRRVLVGLLNQAVVGPSIGAHACVVTLRGGMLAGWHRLSDGIDCTWASLIGAPDVGCSEHLELIQAAGL
jgi:hypothetical protein